MISMRTDISESFRAESLDSCCQALIDGDNEMSGSCLVMQRITAEELVWDSPFCETRTATETTFTLPETMTVGRIETDESSTLESLDLCC